MLTPENKAKLEKKLKEFAKVQAEERDAFIIKRKLDKPGDANWQRYVKKTLAWYDNRYQPVMFRRYRVMMTRAYLDDQKGKKPSPHINL